eukprot:TRINITY_DN16975_c0_g2_i1.p1 TRINITY_DN16975_c0_g2~~TRINITY_DN16975_c0_g2_i1.p1  ORF type:complete len:1003 (-),score=200.46 TRINITY_DN16975_c0_g2_i1:111-3119(-)
MVDGSHIKVCVRVRPLREEEVDRGEEEAVRTVSEAGEYLQLVPTKASCGSSSGVTSHTFDWVVGSSATQNTLYRLLGDGVASGVRDGYHGCVFAYGQTGSGKSHSIFGGAPSEAGSRGMLPRIVDGLFAQLREQGTNHIVKVSYLEIYNEKIRDLLAPPDGQNTSSASSLEVRQHPQYGVFVENLLQNVVSSPEDVTRLLDFGSKMRIVGATCLNAVSSRSHAVVSLHVEQETGDGSKRLKRTAKLHCVDLAGSERLAQAGEGAARQKESKNINSSLSALSLVISKLAEKESSSRKGADLSSRKSSDHIPYRNSKLTMLLSDSLMGNCRTVMLACVSPAGSHFAMTQSTIRFATSVKKIRTKPVKNEEVEGATIQALQSEIALLRAQLATASGSQRKVIGNMMETGSKLLESLNTSWDEAVLRSSEVERERSQTLHRFGLNIESMQEAVASGRTVQVPADAEPYLTNLCSDPLLSGCLMYSLPEGKEITVGSDSSCTIVLEGLGMQPCMCSLTNKNGMTVEVNVEVPGCSQKGLGFQWSAPEPSRMMCRGRWNRDPTQKNRRASLYKGGVSKVFVNANRVTDTMEMLHEDRLRIGPTHVLQLFIPKAKAKALERKTVTMRAGSIVEMMLDDADGEQILAKEYAEHLEQRIGRRGASRVFSALQDLRSCVEEANEITQELRGEEAFGLEFRAHVLTEVMSADHDPDLAVTLYKSAPSNGILDGIINGGSSSSRRQIEAIWTVDEFKERLDVLWSLHDEISERDLAWGQAGDYDPWSHARIIPRRVDPRQSGAPVQSFASIDSADAKTWESLRSAGHNSRSSNNSRRETRTSSGISEYLDLRRSSNATLASTASNGHYSVLLPQTPRSVVSVAVMPDPEKTASFVSLPSSKAWHTPPTTGMPSPPGAGRRSVVVPQLSLPTQRASMTSSSAPVFAWPLVASPQGHPAQVLVPASKPGLTHRGLRPSVSPGPSSPPAFSPVSSPGLPPRLAGSPGPGAITWRSPY